MKEEGMKRNNSGSSLPVRQGTPGGTALASVPGGQVARGAATGSTMSSADAKQLVDYHNQVRAEVGVGKLSSSPELASYAQEWADHLAKKGKFEHRPASEKKFGENLAAGSHPGYNGLSGAQGWYGEKSLYKARAPFSVEFMEAGHYTQMVWRGSTQIGAATAVCTKGKYKGWTIVVCNYNPGGNMLGQPAY
jgi:pathogenesis-related protein 1